jgi:hypothetical protein
MIILGYLGGYSLNYNPTPDITVIKHLCAIQTLQVDSWHKITQNLINAKTTNIPHSHHYTINHVRTRRDSVSSIFQQLICSNSKILANKIHFSNKKPQARIPQNPRLFFDSQKNQQETRKPRKSIHPHKN